LPSAMDPLTNSVLILFLFWHRFPTSSAMDSSMWKLCCNILFLTSFSSHGAVRLQQRWVRKSPTRAKSSPSPVSLCAPRVRGSTPAWPAGALTGEQAEHGGAGELGDCSYPVHAKAHEQRARRRHSLTTIGARRGRSEQSP
jgi:hypothetical protein